MKFPVQALLLGSSIFQYVDAGHFSDRVMERYKRPEKFAARRSEPLLLRERATHRYSSNKTQRKEIYIGVILILIRDSLCGGLTT